MKQSKVNQANCTHHWRLGQPQRGLVHGVCKRCGLERDFLDEAKLTRQEAAQMAIEFRKGVTGRG